MYMYTLNINIRTVYVLVDINGKDVRTDGQPWNFLQSSSYKLTSAQNNLLNKIKRYLKSCQFWCKDKL